MCIKFYPLNLMFFCNFALWALNFTFTESSIGSWVLNLRSAFRVSRLAFRASRFAICGSCFLFPVFRFTFRVSHFACRVRHTFYILRGTHYVFHLQFDQSWHTSCSVVWWVSVAIATIIKFIQLTNYSCINIWHAIAVLLCRNFTKGYVVEFYTFHSLV